MRKLAWFVVIWVIFFCLMVNPSFAGFSVGSRASVKSNIANVRSDANLSASVLWKVEKYYPIVVVAKKGAWYRFKDFEGDEGWISESTLSSKKTVIAINSKCNIRSGPGLDNAVVFTAERGTPFMLISIKGDWRKIKHADGDTGWIHKNLVW